ncbi:hypothetical protein HAX54_039285, partial [Datura stramonium]|nr:hypothetical protein [Datura stramonium]
MEMALYTLQINCSPTVLVVVAANFEKGGMEVSEHFVDNSKKNLGGFCCSGDNCSFDMPGHDSIFQHKELIWGSKDTPNNYDYPHISHKMGAFVALGGPAAL